MLNKNLWAVTLGCWMAISFAVCVLGGVIAPSLPIAHKTLELLLPGFVWISFGAFVLGLIESFLFGLYAGWLLVVIHNFLARRWEVTQRAAGRVQAA